MLFLTFFYSLLFVLFSNNAVVLINTGVGSEEQVKEADDFLVRRVPLPLEKGNERESQRVERARERRRGEEQN